MTTVKQTKQQAVFIVTIHRPEDIGKFMCEAQNNRHKEGMLSKRLNATVIGEFQRPSVAEEKCIYQVVCLSVVHTMHGYVCFYFCRERAVKC